MINLYLITFVIYLLSTLTRVFNLGIKQDVEVVMELDGSNTLSTAIGLLLLTVSFIIIYKKRELFAKDVKNLTPMLLLYLVALLSVFWSDSPFITLKRFLKILVYLSFFISIFSMPDTIKNIRKILLMFSGFSGISSLILILFFREYGWMNYEGDYLPCGIFVHKNALAIFSALMILLTFIIQELHSSQTKKHPLHIKILYLVLLIEVLISGATDVVGGLLIGCIVGYPIFKFIKITNSTLRVLVSLSLLLIVLSICLYSSIVYLNVLDFYNDTLLSIGKDPTLTGRSDIWPILLQIGIKSHPILGSGLGSFFILIDNVGYSRTLPWLMSHAHNTYLQSYLELGLPGLISSIYIAVVLLKKIINESSEKNSIGYALIVLFILYIVQTLFEVVLLRPTTIFAFLPLIFYIINYNRSHAKLINN